MLVEQSTFRHYQAHVNSTSQPFSPATKLRNYLAVINTGGNVAYLRFGQDASATTSETNGDIPVAAGQTIEYTDVVPIDSVNLIAPSGDTICSIIEGRSL